MWFVYSATCRVTERVYIGKTNNIAKRWSDHLGLARKRSTTYFHAAIRKYGHDAFEWCAFECHDTDEQAQLSEKAWIARLRSANVQLYNLTDGGDGTSGHRLSDETRARISAARQGWQFSAETRAKIGRGNAGKRRSEETKAKISASKRGAPGTPHTEEAKRKISLASSQRRHSEETRAKMSKAHFRRHRRRREGLI